MFPIFIKPSPLCDVCSGHCHGRAWTCTDGHYKSDCSFLLKVKLRRIYAAILPVFTKVFRKRAIMFCVPFLCAMCVFFMFGLGENSWFTVGKISGFIQRPTNLFLPSVLASEELPLLSEEDMANAAGSQFINVNAILAISNLTVIVLTVGWFLCKLIIKMTPLEFERTVCASPSQSVV